MSNIQIFKYRDKEVRTVDQNGETWWVLKDVCEALLLSNPAKVAQRLDDDEKGITESYTLGGEQEVLIINESGLYSVILRSNKQEAKTFRKWVTSEVLPSIRKHGAYMTPQVIEEAILNPDTIIKLATALKSEQEKNKTLQILNSDLSVKNQIMAPKADYFDELVDRNLLTNFRETAKQLKVREKDFIEFLLERKYIYRDKKGKLLPYADKNNGLFEVKECYNEKTDWSGIQTLITPKGRETFRLLMAKSA